MDERMKNLEEIEAFNKLIKDAEWQIEYHTGKLHEHEVLMAVLKKAKAHDERV